MRFVFVCLCLLIVFSASCCRAEIVDLTGIPISDGFIDLGKRVSYDGSVYLAVVDGIPYINALFKSKLPLGIATDMYNSYLEENGIDETMFRCSYCPPDYVKFVWSGFLGDKESTVIVDSVDKSGEIIINVSSSLDERIFDRYKEMFIESYAEFTDLAGEPEYSYETINGSSRSVVIVYNIIDSPQLEIEDAVRNLVRAGWQDLYGEVFGSSKDGKAAMLVKDSYNATLACTEEGLVVSIIPR